MSTRASVAWDDSFHLYEELMDDKLWLEVEVQELEVTQWKAKGPVRITFPVPFELIRTVFLPKYRHFPATPAERRRRAKRASANLERLLRGLDERKAGAAEMAGPPLAVSNAARPGRQTRGGKGGTKPRRPGGAPLPKRK